MGLLKKRIDSAAETIANGVQPRSKEEALNQCVCRAFLAHRPSLALSIMTTLDTDHATHTIESASPRNAVLHPLQLGTPSPNRTSSISFRWSLRPRKKFGLMLKRQAPAVKFERSALS